PPRIAELFHRCLEKDPRRRLRDVGDAQLDVDTRRGSMDRVPAAVHGRRSVTRAIVWAVCGAGVGLLGGFLLAWRPGATVDGAVKHLALTLPPGLELVAHGNQAIAISPDGTRLVFPGRRG